LSEKNVLFEKSVLYTYNKGGEKLKEEPK